MGSPSFTAREQLLIDTAVREAARRSSRAQSAAESTAAGLLAESATVPTGAIVYWGTATPPDGYLLCDGSSLLRATYTALFAVIGTVYGSVDGTHFTLPDLRGRVVVGLHSGQTEFDALAETGGARTVTLDLTMIPAHTHTYTAPDPPANQLGIIAGASVITGRSTGQASGSAGGGAAHNNLQPYLVLNGIIKT